MDFSFLLPYLGFFSSLVAAGFGAPIPEELPVVGAGIWAAAPGTLAKYGVYRFLVLPVCILGVVISDGCLYAIGRIFGTRLLDTRFAKRFVPVEKRVKIEENFSKHGIKILLFARLMPGIRAPMFVMSGVMKLSLPKFILADGIYAIPGVSLLFFLAYWFRGQFEKLIHTLGDNLSFLKPLLIIILITAVVVYMIYKFIKKPVSDGDPEDILPASISRKLTEAEQRKLKEAAERYEAEQKKEEPAVNSPMSGDGRGTVHPREEWSHHHPPGDQR